MAPAGNPRRDAAEQDAIRHVTARLAQQFPELASDEIDRAVHGHYDKFNHGPIRDFVPILVERATRQQLSERSTPRHA